MANVHVEAYKVLNGKSPFNIKHLWAVKEPSMEFNSKNHGDLALTFKDDGSIEILYWSPNIPIEAENVVPTHLILKP